MRLKQPSKQACLSCGMSLEKPEDFGTNANGSRSDQYCRFCLQNGKRKDSDIDYGESEKTS